MAQWLGLGPLAARAPLRSHKLCCAAKKKEKENKQKNRVIGSGRFIPTILIDKYQT